METDSWRAQTKPCAHQNPGERSSNLTRDWPRLSCECPGVFGGGMSWWWHATGLGALSVACRGPLKGGHHCLYYLNHRLVSDQTKGREHSSFHQEKIGLNIYWAWPHPSEQDPVSPSASLSHQETSISLLSLSLRGQTEWKPQSKKTIQTDHMGHNHA